MNNHLKDLVEPSLYINRELSMLEFDRRVLTAALDKALPLLERVRYLLIFSANLDEFFEIRVADLKQKIAFSSTATSIDGLTPDETLKQVLQVSHDLINQQYQILNTILLPELAAEKIRFVPIQKWNDEQNAWVTHYFKNELLPVVSVIGLDLARPFPRLVNKSLNFIVALEGKDAFGRASGLAILHVPRAVPRVMRFPSEHKHSYDFVILAQIVKARADDLFPGMTVKGCYQFRLTRNSDLFLDEDNKENKEDLANALKRQLLARRYGTAVRLEISDDCPKHITDFLLKQHGLTTNELYPVSGPVNLSRFFVLQDMIDRPDLKFSPFFPGLPKELHGKPDIFSAIREHDILLHHPFQAFTPVLEFIRQATVDPDVIAIKQILYRTGPESLMVKALIDAARAGKEVTAVIELRARFEEEYNIELANRLQEAGALVVYGVMGYKTHAKLTLVVRREGKKMRRYCHLGTGNYHAIIARSYTDFGLLTYNQDICDDVQNVFQQLTGMGKVIKLKQLLHAPFTLFTALIDLIEQEIIAAEAGKPARIIVKMNALTEPKIIQALYRASIAGVQIDLIIRGICSLRPEVAGVSDNIRVRSFIGRFLEHERIYYFYHGGKEKIFCSSADWMERNLFHRVEVCFPVLDKKLARRVKFEGLQVYLSKRFARWELRSDGTYEFVRGVKNSLASPQSYLLKKLGHHGHGE